MVRQQEPKVLIHFPLSYPEVTVSLTLSLKEKSLISNICGLSDIDVAVLF